VKVNKLSLKQGGGSSEQPSHQMPDGSVMPGATHQEAEGQPIMQDPNQQQDPAIAQITEMVSSALSDGEDPVGIVMALIEQQVDQNIIAQAFMSGGYAEEDVVALFETVQQKSQPPAAASAEEQTKDPQEIARNQAMQEEAVAAESQEAEMLAAEQDAMSETLMGKSGIEIKPENKGKFTKWAKARGMSVSEAYNKVMSNKDKYAPNVVKMANFAKNAAGWKKEEGGEQEAYKPHFMYKGKRKIRAKDMETHLRLKEAGYNHDTPKAQPGGEQGTQLGRGESINTNGEKVNKFGNTNAQQSIINQNTTSKQTTYPTEYSNYRNAMTARSVWEDGDGGKNFLKDYPQQAELDSLRTVYRNLPNITNIPKGKQGKEMIKRADGSYSQRGMWDNIRANKGSGKKPTAEMLAEGRKLKTAQTGTGKTAAQKFYETTGVVKRGDVLTNTAPRYTLPTTFSDGTDFTVSGALSTLADVGSTLFSSELDENGLKSGTFMDWKKKGAVEDEIKGNYYNYEGTIDLNDPNQYAGDNLDLYNASKYKRPLRTVEQYSEDVMENSMVNYNEETKEYDFTRSSRKINPNLPGVNQNSLDGENLNYFNEVDAKTRQELLDFGSSDAPEGTTLSIDEMGATSYVDPEAENLNEYGTMMGYNKSGVDRRPKVIEEEQTSMIQPNEQGMFREPSIVSVDQTEEPLSFKEWAMQDSVRRMGANAPQQYQDYINGVETETTKPSLEDKIKTGLNEAGEFIESKYNQAAPVVRKGIDDAGMFVKDKVNSGLEYLENKFKEGGDLPKAQFAGQPGFYDALSEFTSNLDYSSNSDQSDMFNQQQMSFDNNLPFDNPNNQNAIADLNNAISFGQQTDYNRDTEAVKRAQIDNGTYGNNKQQCPEGQEYDEVMGQCVLKTVDVVEDEVAVAKPLYEPDAPTVKRTNKFSGGLNRFLDSKEVGAFEDVSTAAVAVAGVANDFFRERSVNEATASNRANATADEVYGVNEDPFMKRGSWDINTGTFGSEGQRTVRTNMGTAKNGGGINNAGFKALPPQAQQNILDNMLYGGDPNPGIRALRKVAPEVVSKMGYKSGGETINVNSTILAKLIAAGADIEIL
tara:strand:- start:26856 stop:30140 length:3285 start_codon:yes stop_codon:yes gene_type:complete